MVSSDRLQASGSRLQVGVERIHVLFRRETTTTEQEDFELLGVCKVKVRFIGSVIGVRNLLDGA